MRLTASQVQLARHAVGDVLARSGNGRRYRVPDGLQALFRDLTDAVIGNESNCCAEQLDHGEEREELIGCIEAAAILGCKPRRVRQLAADLDGQHVGRAWVFKRSLVIEYADGRSELLAD